MQTSIKSPCATTNTWTWIQQHFVANSDGDKWRLQVHMFKMAELFNTSHGIKLDSPASSSNLLGTTPQHLSIDSRHSADHSFYPMVLSVICAWLRNDLRVHDSPATRECEMNLLLLFHLFSGILQFGVMWIILKWIYPQIQSILKFTFTWLGCIFNDPDSVRLGRGTESCCTIVKRAQVASPACVMARERW